MISKSGEGAQNQEAMAAAKGGAESSRAGLKKGPWTAAEDSILMEYVKKFGEGNWNAVQKNCGLMRCGKSCRLRWANHLRPNLKKGSFSGEEERIIIELHAKLGNKWARMAAQLPGRTDNEIKNYWNTRMKRRQRAGLPLYPQEVQQEAAVFHLLQQQHHQKQPHSSSVPFSAFLSSSQPRKLNYNPSLSVFNTMNFSSPTNPIQNQVTPGFYSNPSNQFKFFSENNNNPAYALPLSPVSPFGSSPSPIFNQNIAPQPLSAPFVEFNSDSFGSSQYNRSPVVMGPAPYEPFGLVQGLETELPSNQTPLNSTTHTSSNSSGDENPLGASSSANDYEIENPLSQSPDNSGLLDALLVESQTLCEKSKGKEVSSAVTSDKGKGVMVEASTEEEDPMNVDSVFKTSGETSAENHWDDLSSSQSQSQSSIGMKPAEDPLEEMNSMDDDLASLLTNFPSAMPTPEWYRGGRHLSNGQSSGVESDNVRLDTQQSASPAPVTNTTEPELEWGLSPCYWKNLPGIC